MVNSLIVLSLLLWVLAAIVALLRRWVPLGRSLLTAGCVSGIVAAVTALPGSTNTVSLAVNLIGEPVAFRMDPEALWLMGFGLVPAAFAVALFTPSKQGQSGWILGAASSFIGAVGVFGLQNGAGLLIAWELMSLGGALMILPERLGANRDRHILFMLALLEVGSVALVLAVAILGLQVSSLDFSRFI